MLFMRFAFASNGEQSIPHTRHSLLAVHAFAWDDFRWWTDDGQVATHNATHTAFAADHKDVPQSALLPMRSNAATPSLAALASTALTSDHFTSPTFCANQDVVNDDYFSEALDAWTNDLSRRGTIAVAVGHPSSTFAFTADQSHGHVRDRLPLGVPVTVDVDAAWRTHDWISTPHDNAADRTLHHHDSTAVEEQAHGAKEVVARHCDPLASNAVAVALHLFPRCATQLYKSTFAFPTTTASNEDNGYDDNARARTTRVARTHAVQIASAHRLARTCDKTADDFHFSVATLVTPKIADHALHEDVVDTALVLGFLSTAAQALHDALTTMAFAVSLDPPHKAVLAVASVILDNRAAGG